MCDEHHPLSIKRRHSQCPKVNRHDTRNDRERLVIVESIHHLTGDERDDSFLHATCIIWRSSFPIVLLLYTREREITKKKKKTDRGTNVRAWLTQRHDAIDDFSYFFFFCCLIYLLCHRGAAD